MQQIFIFSFFLLLIFSLLSFGIQIYVARKLNKLGVYTGRFYTTGAAILTLVRGWQYADELALREVMIAWSIVFGAAIVSGILVLLTMSAIPRK